MARFCPVIKGDCKGELCAWMRGSAAKNDMLCSINDLAGWMGKIAKDVQPGITQTKTASQPRKVLEMDEPEIQELPVEDEEDNG